MVAYGKTMRPSLVDVMEELNELDSEMDKKLVLIVGYTGSVYPAPATLEHTNGTAVTYNELAGIANTVVTAFDTHFGAAVLADIQKQIDDSIEVAYQTNRYDDTAQAVVFDKVTVHLDSDDMPTVNVDTYTFSGGSYTLPTASAETLGGVKVGSGLAINSDGVLSASGGGGTSEQDTIFAFINIDKNETNNTDNITIQFILNDETQITSFNDLFSILKTYPEPINISGHWNIIKNDNSSVNGYVSNYGVIFKDETSNRIRLQTVCINGEYAIATFYLEFKNENGLISLVTTDSNVSVGQINASATTTIYRKG